MERHPVETALPMITRRRLLHSAMGVVAVAAAPGFLAACGSDNSGTTAATGGGPEPVGGTLNYLGWEGEDFTELLAPWSKKNGVKVQSSYINNMSDIAAKYAAGGAEQIDILNFSSNGTLRLAGSGVPLMALDLEKIPNYKGLEPAFKENSEEAFQNEAGETVAVPTCWGALGITYDSKQIKTPTAYAQLLEPDFTNKITVLDDPSTCFGLAAAILGFRTNEMDEEQFEQAKTYLSEMVAQAKQISPSFGDMANLLASGEVVAAFGGFPLVDAFAAEAGNSNIKTNIEPQEGKTAFSEVYGIPETGQNPATAYSMINQLLDPATNAGVANTLLLAPTVGAAWPKVEPGVKELFPSTKPKIDGFLSEAPFLPDPPAQSTEFVTFGELTTAWTEIKAGS